MPPRSPFLTVLGSVHRAVVFSRRVDVLSRELAALLPPGRMVDVGSGSGLISAAIVHRRPDVAPEGFDVLVRPGASIPTTAFDGAILVDVLHHAADPLRLLSECARVARTVLVKDHLSRSWFDRRTLELMDWIGNRPHGVVLPFTYFGPVSWTEIVSRAGLVEASRTSVPDLYPFPLSALFGRELHFLSRLERAPRRG